MLKPFMYYSSDQITKFLLTTSHDHHVMALSSHDGKFYDPESI
jgi:hypothetical protein